MVSEFAAKPATAAAMNRLQDDPLREQIDPETKSKNSPPQSLAVDMHRGGAVDAAGVELDLVDADAGTRAS